MEAMKQIVVFVFVLLVVSIWHQNPILAASPTPRSTPVPTVVIQGVKAVNAGTLNTVIDESQSYSFEGSETAKTIGSPPPVFLTAGSDFVTFDLTKLSTMLSGATAFLSPGIVNDNKIDQEANLYISGRATRCVYEDGKQPTKTKSNLYTTEVVPELSTLDQATRQIAPLLTRYSLTPNTDATYDFRREPLELGSNPECEETDRGTVQQEKIIKTTQPFSLGAWLLKIFGKKGDTGTIKATFASKQLTPYAESIHCLINGCVEMDLSMLESTDEQTRVKESGGIAKTYAPISHDTTKGETHGEQTNEFSGFPVKTHTTQTKAVENAGNYIMCSILPESQHALLGLADACKNYTTEQTPTTCSTKTLPPLTGVSSSCTLAHTTSINAYTDDASFPSGDIPPTMKAILEKAGETFHVPPSLILGVMYHEGAFSNNRYAWTEENVKKWSLCGQQMPNCDKTKTSVSQTPFGFIPYWFYKGDGGTGSVWNAVSTIDPSRNTKDLVSPCNFLDGVFALAKNLAMFYAAKNVDCITHNVTTCEGYSIVDTRQAPTSCAWDSNRVAQARIGYAGYCPEPGKHTVSPAMPDNDPFISRAIIRWNAFKNY